MTVFKHTQAFYDAVYSYKDYRAEARALSAIIARHKRSKGKDLLDVACGTGAHLEHLAGGYRCTGVDIDAAMLRVARERVKGARFAVGDMRSFDLHREFDAVVCLFSSIGYARTRKGLEATVATLARHVKAGGVVIVEPWILRGNFGSGRAGVQVGEAGGVTVARAYRSSARGPTSKLHFHYLIAANGKVRSVRESHTLGLFTRAEYERAFTRAGLSVRFYARGLTGRGLFVGTKPAPRAGR